MLGAFFVPDPPKKRYLRRYRPAAYGSSQAPKSLSSVYNGRTYGFAVSERGHALKLDLRMIVWCAPLVTGIR